MDKGEDEVVIQTCREVRLLKYRQEDHCEDELEMPLGQKALGVVDVDIIMQRVDRPFSPELEALITEQDRLHRAIAVVEGDNDGHGIDHADPALVRLQP